MRKILLYKRDKPTTLLVFLVVCVECLFLVSTVERITMDRLKKTAPFVHSNLHGTSPWREIKDVLYFPPLEISDSVYM
jgi:hypothetical protein